MEKYNLDIHYEPFAPKKEDYALCYPKRQVLCHVEDGIVTIPKIENLLDTKEKFARHLALSFTYLFTLEGKRYFTLLGPEAEMLFERGLRSCYELHELREIRQCKPFETDHVIALGSQLYFWYQNNRFCGRCGHATVLSDKERCILCPDCRNMIFPRINPSVIVGVLHENRLLVTRYSPKHVMMGNAKNEHPTPHYALVAGYIESGETPEEAVKREVLEETGLKVKNLRHFRNQAWPWTSSLLFGYTCEVDGDADLKIDEEELSTAVFLSREEMPDESGKFSLTAAIMEAFRHNQLDQMEEESNVLTKL